MAALRNEEKVLGAIDHRLNLVGNISKLLKSGSGDIEVIVEGGKVFKVHGFLFAASSPVFERLLYGWLFGILKFICLS